MQNRYVGDVGDFGKYGLLKALCMSSDDNGQTLSLGVVWYLVTDEESNDDGKHTEYLNGKAAYRNCDEGLYDSLAEIVKSAERDIRKIKGYGVLPAGTVFYNSSLSYEDTPRFGKKARDRRSELRNEWVGGACEKTRGCDIIFVDPDNGLEVSSVKPHYKRGPKYAFYDELLKFIEDDKSLVIYQHMSRRGTAEAQIKRGVSQLKERLNVSTDILALRFHRGTSRVFFIIPSKQHKDIITERVKSFLAGPWKEHFTHVSTN